MRLTTTPTLLIVAALAALPTSIASAAILNVPADYATIQGAVDATVDGDEVLIAPGTYVLEFEILVNDKAITIRGSGGADVTILQSSDFWGIMVLSNVESDTIIDGLSFADSNPTLRQWVVQFSGSPVFQNCIFRGNTKSALTSLSNAGALITNCSFTDNQVTSGVGGAISIVSGGTISGCTFTNNSAPNSGGAVFLIGGTIIDCTFESNATTDGASSGGGAVFASAGMVIDACSFIDNGSASTGGAVSATPGGGITTISNCDFTGNTAATDGGAFHGAGVAAADISLVDCTFSDNVATAGFGGGLALDDGVVSGSTFTGNSALNGGGVHLEGAASADTCTFFGNLATGDGGAMYASGGAPSISNCQATDNIAIGTGGGLHIAASTTVTLNDAVLCMNTPDQIDFVGILLGGNVLACDQPLDAMGACCLPAGDCVMTTATSCAAAGGTYAGDSVACIDAACPDACPEDSAGPSGGPDGVVGINDFLAVLANWGVCP